MALRIKTFQKKDHLEFKKNFGIMTLRNEKIQNNDSSGQKLLDIINFHRLACQKNYLSE